MLPTLISLGTERKRIMKSVIATTGLVMLLTTPALATVEWDFDSGGGSSTANKGSGSATVTPGRFGTGWHDGSTAPWSSFGASGFWDMGRNGTIVLAGSSEAGSLTLRVLEWVNPGTFTGNLTYQVSGGSSGSFQSPWGGAIPGTWQQWVATINLGVGQQVTITGPSGGAIIDRVMLSVIPEPATMIAAALLLIPFGLSTWRVLRPRGRS
jgi:hypothetical protein